MKESEICEFCAALFYMIAGAILISYIYTYGG